MASTADNPVVSLDETSSPSTITIMGPEANTSAEGEDQKVLEVRQRTPLATAHQNEKLEDWPKTIALGVLALGLGWFSLWCLFKDAALPGKEGWLFSLVVVYLFGTAGGMVAERIRIPTSMSGYESCGGQSVALPGLVGMLVMGFVVRNVFTAVDEDLFALDKNISSKVRGIALAVILIRAGLGLSLDDMWRLKGTMATMSTVPATVEAVSGMCFAMALFGFDVKWGFMLGFILADVSPAVTVPLLLKFQELGQGSDQGIPSILLAASSLNSVFAICCFGIVQGFNFTGSGVPIWETILRGVLDVVGGVGVGVLSGYVICWLTVRFPSHIKFSLTLIFACVQIFGMKVDPIRSSGGNALATLIMGLTISNVWAKEEYEGMQASFNMVWKTIGERMMFSLLGASMAISDLDPDVVGAGLVIIFAGLIFRGIAAMASISFTGWNLKEMLFTAITWCPKATVQAALSTVALDYVEDHASEFGGVGSDQYIEAKDWATKLKTVAILSIIATAPLFAALMDWGGMNLLEPSKEAPAPAPHGKLVLVSNHTVREEIDEALDADTTDNAAAVQSVVLQGLNLEGTGAVAPSKGKWNRVRKKVLSVTKLPVGVNLHSTHHEDDDGGRYKLVSKTFH